MKYINGNKNLAKLRPNFFHVLKYSFCKFKKLFYIRPVFWSFVNESLVLNALGPRVKYFNKSRTKTVVHNYSPNSILKLNSTLKHLPIWTKK